MATPWGATDCHHHIGDRRFAKADGSAPTEATVAQYRVFKRRLGLTRSIVIAASSHGDDNSVVLDALDQLGPDAARGVAIVRPGVTDEFLDQLHRSGVRGMRFYLGKGSIPTAHELRQMAERAHSRGWHVQIVGDRDRELIAEWEATLASLPCPVVIDHMGYAPQPGGETSATAKTMFRLLRAGNTYVKLSGVYIQSKVGFPSYSDVDNLAIALVQCAPERMLWGTDWPHPGAGSNKPDGAMLLDRLAIWAPAESTRRLILVDNPQRLYWGN